MPFRSTIPFLFAVWMVVKMLACTAAEVRSSTALDYAEGSALDTFWGYRFEVVGDFDGDGHADTLRDHFLDTKTGWETYRAVSAVDEPMNVVYNEIGTGYWEVLGRSGAKLSTPRGQSALWMEVLDDLNGNGGQELCVVFDNQDYSNVNKAVIYTWEGAWTVLYAFEIREIYDVPDWPEVLVHRDTQGRPFLSVAESAEAQAVWATLRSHTLVEPLSPNTFEVVAYAPYDLKGVSDLPIERTGTCVWFEVERSVLPPTVRGSQVALDLNDYSAQNRADILRTLEAGQGVDDWYEYGTPYRVRVQLW